MKEIVKLSGLSETWCKEALELLCIQDVCGIVKREVSRLKKSRETRIKRKPEIARDELSDTALLESVEVRAPDLLASKLVRPAVLESISLNCWNSLVKFTHSNKLIGVKSYEKNPDFTRWLERTGRTVKEPLSHQLWIQRLIGRNLGVDETNLERWEKSKTTPNGDKVLGGVLIGLMIELRESEFPKRKDILLFAASRALAYVCKSVRTNNSKAKPEKNIDIKKVMAIRRVFKHRDRDSLLLEPNDDVSAAQKRLIVEVGMELATMFPRSKIYEPTRLRRLIKDLSLPYALYRIGLVSGWNGTEDQWNWGHIDGK